MDIAAPKLLLCETNGVFLDTYQFDTLDYFTNMANAERLRWQHEPRSKMTCR